MSLVGSTREVSISKHSELLLAIFRILQAAVGWVSLAHGPLHDNFLHQIKVEKVKESASKMTAIIISTLSFILKLLGAAPVSEIEITYSED